MSGNNKRSAMIVKQYSCQSLLNKVFLLVKSPSPQISHPKVELAEVIVIYYSMHRLQGINVFFFSKSKSTDVI